MSIAPTFSQASKLPHSFNAVSYFFRERLQAKKIAAVTIVGNGNDKNKWNGYSEVQVCESEEPIGEVPSIGGVIIDSTNEVSVDMELSFPKGRKGFNVVNMCVHGPLAHGREKPLYWLFSLETSIGREFQIAK